MLFSTHVFLSKGQLSNEMMTRHREAQRGTEVQMTERGGEREVVTIETFGKSETAWAKVVESSKNIVSYKRTTDYIHNYKSNYNTEHSA